MQNDWQGEGQYLEAGKKLTQYQVERLGKIWALLNERGDHVQDLKKDKGCVFVPRCSVGRPAASEKVVVKKPACQKKMAKAGKTRANTGLHFMTYKTGAVAVRVTGRRQVVQLLSKRGEEHNQKLANQGMQMFKAGKTLGQVKPWKSQAVKQ